MWQFTPCSPFAPERAPYEESPVPGGPLTVVVTMTLRDLALASRVGQGMALDGIRRGLKDRYGPSNQPVFDGKIWPLVAELAVARYTGLPWNGGYGHGVPDVGEDLQVRYTQRPNGRLLAHHGDRKHRLVLVRGIWPDYEIVGWCHGHEACRYQNWTEPAPGRGCFAVPAERLQPPHLLRGTDARVHAGRGRDGPA